MLLNEVQRVRPGHEKFLFLDSHERSSTLVHGDRKWVRAFFRLHLSTPPSFPTRDPPPHSPPHLSPPLPQILQHLLQLHPPFRRFPPSLPLLLMRLMRNRPPQQILHRHHPAHPPLPLHPNPPRPYPLEDLRDKLERLLRAHSERGGADPGREGDAVLVGVGKLVLPVLVLVRGDGGAAGGGGLGEVGCAAGRRGGGGEEAVGVEIDEVGFLSGLDCAEEVGARDGAEKDRIAPRLDNRE